MSASFPIPRELFALIDDGFWPVNADAAQRQNLRPLVAESTIRRFAPEESRIVFYPPPFLTVRALMDGSEKRFWSDPCATVSEIDPDRTVLVGDFGIGSDTAIALDYRRDVSAPSVFRLRWAQEGNHWVEVAPTVAQFVALLRK